VEKTPKGKKARNQLGFSHRSIRSLSIAKRIENKLSCAIRNLKWQMNLKNVLP
jgi:hypothetical protein